MEKFNCVRVIATIVNPVHRHKLQHVDNNQLTELNYKKYAYNNCNQIVTTFSYNHLQPQNHIQFRLYECFICVVHNSVQTDFPWKWKIKFTPIWL